MNITNINLIYFNGPGNGNFGDELSPFIVNKLINSKKYNLFYNKFKKENINFIAIGSMVQAAKNDYHIWGSGLITDKPHPALNDFCRLNIHAVRGPQTYNFLKNMKCKLEVPQIYGDPSLLCPEFLKPEIIQEYSDKIGIVPHYDNYNKILDMFNKSSLNKLDYIFINPLDEEEEVITKIISCRYIISNSLHGLIISDAYNIPNVWLNIQIAHHSDFKFTDYFQSQSREIKFIRNFEEFEITNYAYNGGNKINLDLLKEAFPFK
jgi:pyruvyltransferase